jgi:hypothetical protein
MKVLTFLSYPMNSRNFANSNRWKIMLLLVAWVEIVPVEELPFQVMMAVIDCLEHQYLHMNFRQPINFRVMTEHLEAL